jgi:hypothetical protein
VCLQMTGQQTVGEEREEKIVDLICVRLQHTRNQCTHQHAEYHHGTQRLQVVQIDLQAAHQEQSGKHSQRSSECTFEGLAGMSPSVFAEPSADQGGLWRVRARESV